MIKAILFDFFGVLYPDTFWTIADEIIGDEMQSKRPQLHDLVRQVDTGLITQDELWEGLAVVAGTTKDIISLRLEEFNGVDKRLLRFIEEHKESYKFGMISNVGKGFVEGMFTDSNKSAEYYFDTLVLSGDEGVIKPDKRIYELAAKNLGVETSECVFIDDIPRNADGATLVGMIGILYISYNQFIKDISELLALQ